MTRNGGHWVVPGQETRGRWGSLTGVTDPFLHSSGEKPEPSSWQHNISSHSGLAKDLVLIAEEWWLSPRSGCTEETLVDKGQGVESELKVEPCACKLLDIDSKCSWKCSLFFSLCLWTCHSKAYSYNKTSTFKTYVQQYQHETQEISFNHSQARLYLNLVSYDFRRHNRQSPKDPHTQIQIMTCAVNQVIKWLSSTQIPLFKATTEGVGEASTGVKSQLCPRTKQTKRFA